MQSRRGNSQVSPAYAGMDLQSCGGNYRKDGFPRLRGDGPPFIPYAAGPPAFPPPTRGWTYW